MNVGQMLGKRLIAAVLLIIVIALGTGIYFITEEKPEAGPLPTELTVATSASTVRYRLDPVTLTATLTSNGAPIEGKVINWSDIPGIGVGIPPYTTDSSGQVSIYFPYFPPPSPSSIKFPLPTTLTFTASFAGDNQYRGNTGSTSIEVKLAKALSVGTISRETYGRYENHEYLVIENSGEWEKVWLLAQGSEAYPIPEVGFSFYAVIAVFMGGQPTGGYEILIEQITNAENEIIVNVKEIYPGRIYVTLVSSSPHHVIKIERVQKLIVFEVRQFLAHAWDENWDPYDEIMYELVGEHRVEASSGPPEP